jgi:hypothetical protein
MRPLQCREKEIFETLKAIYKNSFVVIGGYAVNAYTLPRFSVDCDIVTKDNQKAHKLGDTLVQIGYSKEKIPKNTTYYGTFERYEKEIEKDFNVSMGILIGQVLDRQTSATFSADWIFEHSNVRLLKGKTILEEMNVRIIDVEALFVMKFICGRSTDIRDVFMLAPSLKDLKWVREEIAARYDFNDRFENVKKKIVSKQFRDGLQGVYGRIDETVFQKHQKALMALNLFE